MSNKEIIPAEVKYDYSGFRKSMNEEFIRYIVLNRSNPGEDFMGIDHIDFPKVYLDETFVILENPRQVTKRAEEAKIIPSAIPQ
jgi:hypothetical protein